MAQRTSVINSFSTSINVTATQKLLFQRQPWTSAVNHPMSCSHTNNGIPVHWNRQVLSALICDSLDAWCKVPYLYLASRFYPLLGGETRLFSYQYSNGWPSCKHDGLAVKSSNRKLNRIDLTEPESAWLHQGALNFYRVFFQHKPK